MKYTSLNICLETGGTISNSWFRPRTWHQSTQSQSQNHNSGFFNILFFFLLDSIDIKVRANGDFCLRLARNRTDISIMSQTLVRFDMLQAKDISHDFSSKAQWSDLYYPHSFYSSYYSDSYCLIRKIWVDTEIKHNWGLK